MPEIEIRPAVATDISNLIELDHNFATDHVWQMEYLPEHDQSQINVNFRKVRLPRSVRVEYPRPARALTDDWTRLSGLLVAVLEDQPIGYAGLILDRITQATWVTDLVVDRPLRRKGIGSALLLAAAEWAATMDSHNLVLEMQPKNHPAIQLAFKLGFEFCGYNDLYYPDHEIGVFFRKSI
jgi:GNAT superfamily N-acetyltransferase